MRSLACCVFGWILLAQLPSATADDAPTTVDYLRDVKPILSRFCYECHAAKQQKSGLRLDTAAALVTGGDSGPTVVPGKPDESLLIHALTGTNDASRMPPKEPRPTPKQIAVIRKWIVAGAKSPPEEVTQIAEKPQSAHWAFRPVRQPAVPGVRGQRSEVSNDRFAATRQRSDSTDHGPRTTNPIDAFVLAKLAEQGLEPSSQASHATLIRRVSLDLIGLPPSPEEVAAFVKDDRPDAYERLVERLLASPHYGERWGRHWLDLARYADSNGYTRDMARSIWKYREWVIDALNRDLPFDQFTIEQLAGDMLPNAAVDQRIATGFHRNTLINEEGGTDPEQFRIEATVDRVNTTGAVFLGLTIGCCQCHDHKYDPFTQREYYQLFAFFNNAAFNPRDQFAPIVEIPVGDVPAEEAFARRTAIRTQIAELEQQFEPQIPELAADLAAWEKSLTEADRKQLPFQVRNAVELAPQDRGDQHKADLNRYFRELPAMRAKYPLLDEIAKLRTSEPAFISTMVMEEQAEPRETFVHRRGDFLQHGARVQPDVPVVLPPLPTDCANPTRLDLARWLVDPRNPLTPRVTMNRLWQQYFGRGIVETENDFGTQGTPPSHPELLDWLASEFVTQGWSLKAMHRRIVTSATYRQSSRPTAEQLQRDPRNIWLARQTRLRLDAELIRDSALQASGLLSEVIGGPSVYPPQPDGVFDFTQDKKPWLTATGPDRYRRAMYTYLWRSSPYPSLTVFDFPDANVTCTRRIRSNTPLQSLTLANDLTFVEFARGLANRILRETTANDDHRLRFAVQLCLSREPRPAERARLHGFLQEQRAAFAGDSEGASQLVGETLPADVPLPEAAAWTAVARVLLNLDEFISRE